MDTPRCEGGPPVGVVGPVTPTPGAYLHIDSLGSPRTRVPGFGPGRSLVSVFLDLLEERPPQQNLPSSVHPGLGGRSLIL